MATWRWFWAASTLNGMRNASPVVAVSAFKLDAESESRSLLSRAVRRVAAMAEEHRPKQQIDK